MTPALFRRTWSGSFLALNSLANLVTEARERRSNWMNSTSSFWVSVLISSTTARAFEGVREAMMTWAFFFANAKAQALPIYFKQNSAFNNTTLLSLHTTVNIPMLTPVLPPVTMQTLPVISGI
jgi:hypothetical protein